MKKNILFGIIIVSFNFLFHDCTFVHHIFCDYNLTTKLWINKEILSNQNLISFTDSMIINYERSSSLLLESIYFDKKYSLPSRLFKTKYLKDFKDLVTNGYELVDYYQFDVKYLSELNKNDGFYRYPQLNSTEIEQVKKIANIHVHKMGQQNDPKNNDGDLIFTFCLTIDKNWYLRTIEYEFWRIQD